MRRQDREVTDIQTLLEIIGRCQVARLGLSADEGAYIVPMNFGYEYVQEDQKLFFYFHSAKEGRKADMMKKNPAVGFELDHMEEIIRKETACGWTAHYESVIGTGRMTLLETEEEKRHGLDAMMHHYGMTGTGDYPPQMLERTAVWRLEVLEMTGKKNY